MTRDVHLNQLREKLICQEVDSVELISSSRGADLMERRADFMERRTDLVERRTDLVERRADLGHPCELSLIPSYDTNRP